MPNKIFTYPVLIKEMHLDTFGHVNNATYLELLEEARWELITQNGYGLEKIKQTGLGPIILEIKIRFLKEIRLRETIIIETQLVSYKNRIGKLIQTIRRADEVCCTAEIVIGLFDLSQRRLVLPTAQWLRAIGVEVHS